MLFKASSGAIWSYLELGVSGLATSTAGVALDAYVARAGLPAYVVAPENAPETYIQHAHLNGAH